MEKQFSLHVVSFREFGRKVVIVINSQTNEVIKEFDFKEFNKAEKLLKNLNKVN